MTPYLIRLAFGVSAVWLLAAVAAIVARRASAALRHRVWSLATVAVLTLPLLITLLPEHRLRTAVARPASPVIMVRPPSDPLPADAVKPALVPMVVTTTAPPVVRTIPWATLVGVAWAVPAAAILLRLLVGCASARRLVQRSAELRDGSARDCLDQLSGGQRSPRLFESGAVAVPLCVGPCRPAIVLPADWPRWTPDELSAVLTHESAHAARHDVLWQLLAGAATAAYWPHPLAWVAAWRLRVERELACDDAVLARGGSTAPYARWIVDFAERHRPTIVGGVAMAAPGNLDGRIAALLDVGRRRSPVSRRAAMVLSIVAVFVLGLAGSLSPLARTRMAWASQPLATTQPTTLSPGDLVTVEVHGLFSPIDDARVEMHVEQDGAIPLPLTIGGVKVAGLNLADAGQAIDRKYAELNVLRHAGAVVTMFKSGGRPFTIAPQDRVRVRVWSVKPGVHNTVETAEVEEVAPDGTIEAAGLDRVKIGGLTESAAISMLQSLYSKQATREQHVLGVAMTRLDPSEASAAARHPLHVTGRVTSVDHQPVAGVRVTGQVGNQAVEAVSGDDGSFDLAADGDWLDFVSVWATAGDRSGYAERGQWLEQTKSATVDLVLKPVRTVSVIVVDADRRPVSGAWVGVPSSPDKKNGPTETATDGAGHAALQVMADYPIEFVAADKPGLGFDYALFWRPNQPHTDPYRLDPRATGPITLTLNGAAPVTVHVADPAGRPLSGVTVYPWLFQKPKHGDQINLSFVTRHFQRTTGADGTATFETIPVDQQGLITIWPRLKGYCQPARCNYDPAIGHGRAEAMLAPLVKLGGTAQTADGQPAAGLRVIVRGQGVHFAERFETDVTTDAAGRFTVDANPQQYYLFAVSDPVEHLASPAVFRVVRDRPPAEPVVLKVQPATRVHGRLTTTPDGRPAAGVMMNFQGSDRPYDQLPPAERLAGSDRPVVMPADAIWLRTDADGGYEFWAGPGSYDLFPRLDPYVAPGTSVAVTGQPEIAVNLTVPADAIGGVKYLIGRVVDGTAGAAEVAVTAATADGRAFLRPATTDAEGKFTIQRGPAETILYAANGDKSRAGMRVVQADETEVVVPLSPAATFTGRLVEEDGRPAAGCRVYCWIKRVNDMAFAGGTAVSGADGRFTIAGIIPGNEYNFSFARRRPDGAWSNESAGSAYARADQPQIVDVGDQRLTR
jgi:beta-lactamase regulating signal transducer with metallopeptidase domain/protein involved in polysaccharide export with SLBB domain